MIMAFKITTTAIMQCEIVYIYLDLFIPQFFFSKHHFFPSQQKVVKNSVYIKLIYKFQQVEIAKLR